MTSPLSLVERANARVDALRIPKNFDYEKYYANLEQIRDIRGAEEYIDDVIDHLYSDAAKRGMVAAWGGLQVKFRPAELSVWSGFKGSAKSSLLSQCFIRGMVDGEKCMVISPEFRVPAILARKLRQVSGGPEPAIAFVRQWLQWCKGKLWFYDHQGALAPRLVLGIVAYAAKELGATQILIDSLMKCGIAPDDYRGQKEFVDALQGIAHRFGPHVHLVAHARKQETDATPPGMHDVKGTSEIVDVAENVFMIHRNKRDPEDRKPGESDLTVTCVAQRNGDWLGRLKLWFEHRSHQFIEHERAPRYDYASEIVVQRQPGDDYEEDAVEVTA